MYISYIFLAFYNIKKLTFGEAYFCFIYKLLHCRCERLGSIQYYQFANEYYLDIEPGLYKQLDGIDQSI